MAYLHDAPRVDATNELPQKRSASRLSTHALMSRVLCGVFTLLAVVGTSYAGERPSSSQPLDKVRVAGDYGNTPMSFEQNQGQTDRRVQFFARGEGYGLFLTSGEAVLELQRSRPERDRPALAASVLRMGLIGANTNAPASGDQPLPGVVNYFRGNDPGKWAANVHTFGRVSYQGVYPGIDLVYYGNQRQLEYDFVVAPGADPKTIALNFKGASAELDKAGDLVLADGEVRTMFHKPVLYQMSGNARVPVVGDYKLEGQNVRFQVGEYDHSKPLVIDPLLTYSTFLGGGADDRGVAIAADASGNAYIAGDTVSMDFPLVNAYQSTNHNTSNGWVAFVTKLNPAGTAVVYSTFLGGVYDTHTYGLAVDSTGSAYVAGETTAPDFPITANVYQKYCGGQHDGQGNRNSSGCLPGGDTSGFVTKLNPSGSTLAYSTYLSGDGANFITAIAIDASGNAYLGGITTSFCAPPYSPTGYEPFQCFPTTANAVQAGTTNPGAGGSLYGFFTILDAQGANVLYSTLYGDTRTPANGFSPTNVYGVAVDSSGNGYIAGTAGLFIPTTPNAFLPSGSGNPSSATRPGFVAKFNPSAATSASALIYGTYLGASTEGANVASYDNEVTSIVTDANGNAIVAGYANACGYPTTAGAYLTTSNSGPYCQDAFITKLNSSGTALIWSTLFGTKTGGAVSNTTIASLAQDGAGNLYITGSASDKGLPVVNPLVPVVNGGSFLAKLDSTASNLLFSTYLSGYGGVETTNGVAVDVNGNMYVTGKVNYDTPTIPTTPGALAPTYRGGVFDAFVMKVAPLVNSTTALSLSSGSVAVGQSVTLTATVTGPQGAPVPTGTVTFMNGSSTLGTGTLDSSGNATYSSSSLAATTYTVTAQYAGNTYYNASTSSAQSLVISPLATTTTLTITPSSAVAGTSVSMVAKVTPASGSGIPTGTVTFKNGSTQLAAIAVNASGTATFTSSSLAAGTYSVTASYSGDASDASSVSPAASLTLTSVVATTTTLASSATSVTTGTSVTLTATVSQASGANVPTGTVTFTDGATTLGTGALSSGKATYTTSSLAIGTHSITASYAGDTNDTSSTSSALSIVVTGVPSFTLSASPTSATIPAGQSATSTVSVQPVNGFTGTATFACSGLPAHATCTFAPASVTISGGAATTTLTIATSVATAANDATPVLHEQNVSRISLAGIGTLATLLLLPVVASRKRKLGRLPWVAVLVLMLGAAGALSGCGGGTNGNKTPSGQSTVAITATSGSITQTTNFQLTVQ